MFDGRLRVLWAVEEAVVRGGGFCAVGWRTDGCRQWKTASSDVFIGIGGL